MQNQNFTVALVDKNLNIFSKSNKGVDMKISKIIEHESRIDEISSECHFFIDESMYKALDYQGVPYKFTKVFVNNLSKYTSSKYVKIFHISEFNDHVRKYNKFDANKPLFLMGGSDFTKYALKVSSKLLLTVVGDEVTTGYDKFPIEIAKNIFTGRKQIEPTLLKDIKKYRRSLIQKQKQEFIITSGGAKLMKEPEKPNYTDDVLNSPDYMFYEYRR